MKIHILAKSCLLLILLATATKTRAQDKRDVVYLKNESIIRGLIIESDTLKVKIETCCGSLFVFPAEEILRIEEETLPPKGYAVKGKGYINFTSMGSLIGPGNNEKAAPFSLLIEHNYRFNTHLMGGVALGYEVLNESLMPAGITARLTLPVNRNVFFLGGMGGYMLSLENPEQDYFTEAKGGIFVNPELGMLIPVSNNTGFLVSVGYRYGELHYERVDSWLGDVERTMHFNRLSLRLGISFY